MNEIYTSDAQVIFGCMENFAIQCDEMNEQRLAKLPGSVINTQEKTKQGTSVNKDSM